jgi:hypothetical protein
MGGRRLGVGRARGTRAALRARTRGQGRRLTGSRARRNHDSRFSDLVHSAASRRRHRNSVGLQQRAESLAFCRSATATAAGRFNASRLPPIIISQHRQRAQHHQSSHWIVGVCCCLFFCLLSVPSRCPIRLLVSSTWSLPGARCHCPLASRRCLGSAATRPRQRPIPAHCSDRRPRTQCTDTAHHCTARIDSHRRSQQR